MLTEKQRDLLLFIHDRLNAGGLVPSFDEMREALGLKSKSGIHRLISALEERGYIERLPNRARALEIKKLPEALKSQEEKHGSQMIPLYGKIAAGTPIEAIQHEGNYTDIPANMVGTGEHYALTIEGDSMINAGINDGDTVVIRKCDAANTNDIVVALVDGHEATLKRFRTFQGKVALVPENDEYKTRLLDPSRVQIQGQLVSLLRAY